MNIGKQAENLGYSPSISAIDRVIVHNWASQFRSPNVSDAQWDAMTGYILECDCAYATQDVADRILTSVRAKTYQPYLASGATLTPAAELGDTLQVDTITSKIYSVNMKLNGRLATDIEAPFPKEIDHEYPYVSPTDRIVEQRIEKNASEIKVLPNQILLR